MLVFATKPGSIVRMRDPAAQCSVRLLGLDPKITYDTHRSLITRVTVAQQANVQFLHALGSQIFVYAFGDRMGSITLSGLSASCPCPQGNDLGIERILKYYSDNRVSKRKKPVRVTIGKTVLEGFVLSVSGDTVDPSTNIIQWGLNLATLPEDS